MADINFDQFKQEIRVAENYLRAATVRSGSSDSSFSSKVRASADGLVVLDATRKEGILQQFGRRSMVSSLDLPSRLSRRIDDSEDRTVYDRSTFDVASVSTDPFWREGGRSSIPSATDDQAFGRYSSRSEREKLINRLLIDHDSKHREQSSEIVPESNYFNDYHDPVESRRQDVKHNLSQAGAVHSPDSPTTTSDDDNPTSLFFASDIHLSTDFGHRSQVPTFVAAQGTDGDNSYQHESPNVIKVSYSVQDDAFARLTGACADRASYVDKIAVWETSDCNMSDKTPHIRSVLVVPGGNEIYRDNTPGEPVSTSIKNIGNNHFKQEMASEVNVSSKYRYRESSAGGEIIESESVKSDAPVKKTVITKKFHKTKEQLQKEAEATFQKHCAFRPTIQSDDRKSRDRRDMYGTDRIEAMQKSYKKSQEEREKQKKDFLNIELMNCTFQPRITKMGEGTTRTGKVRNTTDSSQFNAVEFLSGGTGYSANEQFQGQRDSGVAGEVSMRLYNDAEQRSTQQQWLERQVVEARLAQFTFQPSINPVTTSYFDTIEYKPIYERVGELQKEREDRRRILKQNYEDAQVDLTFTPAIDPKSRRIAVKKLESEEPQEVSSFSIVTSERDECPPRPAQQTDVGSRLHRQAFSAARRKQELCTKRDELEIMEMEPPRLSKGTEKLALNSFKVGYVLSHFFIVRYITIC